MEDLREEEIEGEVEVEVEEDSMIEKATICQKGSSHVANQSQGQDLIDDHMVQDQALEHQQEDGQ